MIWPIVRGAIYAGLGVAEFVVDVSDRVQQLGRRLLPRKRDDAHPLSWKDVEHQQEQIRRATTPPQGSDWATRVQLEANKRMPPHPKW